MMAPGTMVCLPENHKDIAPRGRSSHSDNRCWVRGAVPESHADSVSNICNSYSQIQMTRQARMKTQTNLGVHNRKGQPLNENRQSWVVGKARPKESCLCSQ